MYASRRRGMDGAMNQERVQTGDVSRCTSRSSCGNAWSAFRITGVKTEKLGDSTGVFEELRS